MPRRGRIVVIAGPTATGKSEVALALAERLGAEIVSADSVQVYREFDIGSAKPDAEARRRVPHHLVDELQPEERIDAGQYAERADRAISAIAARGKPPLVVGGTGLWLRALLRGLVQLPPPDRAVRTRLEAEADSAGSAALHRRLTRVDPRAATNIHPNDRVRIVRALEVYEQTGIPLGEHQARHALGAPRYDALFIVVDVDKGLHAERIQRRTDAMIAVGWAQEVRRLLARWGASVRPFGSVGYKQMREHVELGVPLDETRRRIVKATRLYARRQRTWFGSEPGIDWRTDPATLLEEPGRDRIERHLASREEGA